MIISFVMECSSDAMDDSDDRILTFRNQNELVTYMQNRLLELGFDTAVSNGLRDMFSTINELQSLCILC